MSDPIPSIGYLLHDTARLLRKRFEQRSRHLGLTRAQWQALAFLAKNEGIHQGALAELMEIEPITLMRLLDKLDGCGLIERRQHPTDRRIRLLFTTPKAAPLLTEMCKLSDIIRAEALAGLSDADREVLVRALLLMKSNLAEACTRPADNEANHG